MPSSWFDSGPSQCGVVARAWEVWVVCWADLLPVGSRGFSFGWLLPCASWALRFFLLHFVFHSRHPCQFSFRYVGPSPLATALPFTVICGLHCDGPAEAELKKHIGPVASTASRVVSLGAILVWVAVQSGCVHLSWLECATGLALMCFVLRRNGLVRLFELSLASVPFALQFCILRCVFAPGSRHASRLWDDTVVLHMCCHKPVLPFHSNVDYPEASFGV